jgi:hypothetical protein
MEEKILLLMEETGCDHGEAQLAMELANQDLEKAIKAIKSILRGIIVIKGKFVDHAKNLFGLFIIIYNQRKEAIIRTTGVVSYNPVIYEQPLTSDWHLLEKSIYSYRLLEGSVLDVMKDAESRFNNVISENKDRFLKALSEKDEQKIDRILFDGLQTEELKTQISIEEINLADYHQEQPDGDETLPEGHAAKPNFGRLVIDIEVQEEAVGKKASSIIQGDVVFAHITDDREIAKYLSKLLVSKETQYIPAPVEGTEESETDVMLKLYFTPGIAGQVILKKNARIKVAESENKPFLKRLFGLK